MSMVFNKTLTRERQVRSYTIQSLDAGWVVQTKIDRETVKHLHVTDWHRVERTAKRFLGEVSELCRQGWVEA